MRAARASSVLDGGSLSFSKDGEAPAKGERADAVLAGALRVAEALEGGATALVGVWQRAPLQAIARLHSLAAADLTDPDQLGRPRTDDPDVGRRLELFGEIVGGGSRVPATVLAGVAHGELLSRSVRGGRRCGGARGVPADHHVEWSRPARPRRSRDVLDASGRRISCRGTGLRVGHG